MKKELQDKLFAKYPKIFRQKDLSMKETCMCWGIETGNGWYWLIDNLCSFIQSHIDNYNKYNEPKISQVEATQVKEKFGGLRFYYINGDSEIEGAVAFAEYLSYVTCENCGSTKNVTQTKGYITSLCEDCMKNARS
jgi:hypothetical protein